MQMLKLMLMLLVLMMMLLLLQGWEQSVTVEGEVYFIHHVTKRTTWYNLFYSAGLGAERDSRGRGVLHPPRVEEDHLV